MNFDLTRFLMYVLGFVVAVTVHEFGHAIAADRLGDDTPRRQGRVTLNPLDHLDPAGTLLFLASALFGTGFGWGRPVMTYPARFKYPRRDSVIVSFAGPLMNIIVAALIGTFLRYVPDSVLTDRSVYFQMLCRLVDVNVLLFLFNLIPLPPLDGSKIMAGLLPDREARSYELAMRQFGPILFILLLFTAGRMIGPMVVHMTNVLSDTVSVPVPAALLLQLPVMR